MQDQDFVLAHNRIYELSLGLIGTTYWWFFGLRGGFRFKFGWCTSCDNETIQNALLSRSIWPLGLGTNRLPLNLSDTYCRMGSNFRQV